MAENVGEGGWLHTSSEDGAFVLAAGGEWSIASVASLDGALRRVAPPGRARVTIDLGALERLDTAGAWLLHRAASRFRAAGAEADFAGVKPDHAILLQQIAAGAHEPAAEPARPNALIQVVARVGRATVDAGNEATLLITFIGLVVTTLLRTVAKPRRLRFTSLVFHMEQVGFNALPIVGLISFLIGVVLAYQGAVQLRQFGAEVFVVDLIGVSVLRELGILLTAIIVAGRSGSAFTAQIGSMKVNEEVDAMRTLGLDPVEVLVLPRLLALVITLPFLGFFSDMMGLLGGALMSWVTLDVTPAMFIERLNDAIKLWTFGVGLVKAPVFAALIAVVGCFEGLRVTGSAESVGQLTTRSVVESIFLVIVVDAAFSIFFATIGI